MRSLALFLPYVFFQSAMSAKPEISPPHWFEIQLTNSSYSPRLHGFQPPQLHIQAMAEPTLTRWIWPGATWKKTNETHKQKKLRQALFQSASSRLPSVHPDRLM